MSLAFALIGSIQRFHRLLRHAVARALTTAPSLAGVSPAADTFSSLMGDGASRPRRCRTNQGRCAKLTIAIFVDLVRGVQQPKRLLRDRNDSVTNGDLVTDAQKGEARHGLSDSHGQNRDSNAR